MIPSLFLAQPSRQIRPSRADPAGLRVFAKIKTSEWPVIEYLLSVVVQVVKEGERGPVEQLIVPYRGGLRFRFCLDRAAVKSWMVTQSWTAWAVLLLFLLDWSAADALGARDILYLNKYGEGASNVSWCSDEAFTFLTHEQSRAPAVFPADYSRVTTVNMFSVGTQQVSPLIVSEYAAFSADCVRNGEYIFLTGSLYSAMTKDARAAAQVNFSQFIDVRPRTGSRSGTPALHIRREGVALRTPLRTASDGSVFGEASGQAFDLESIVPSKRSSLIAGGLDYSLNREGVRITVINADSHKLPPGPFRLYGFSAPEIWGMGSYDCSTDRPGCSSNATAVGYYLYTKINTDRARLDVVFTLNPLHEPLVQRWPVVGRSGAAPGLTVSGVAVDAKRCYVLLEPSPGLAENRINGRLKLDLYVAKCVFASSQLQYDQPQIIGQKQASFIVPSLTLDGDFAVITETTDLASQQGDQAEFERMAASRPNVCARFLRTGSWPLDRVNTICARLDQDGADGLSVSPGGGFVHIRSKSNPLVVGREYHNDGAGPAWLNNGEQP